MENLSRAERFEMALPITLTDIEVYCNAIKAIHPEKKTLTVNELIEGMNSIGEAWKNVKPDSVFLKVLSESTLLKDEHNANEISKNALLLWGVVLCGGKS